MIIFPKLKDEKEVYQLHILWTCFLGLDLGIPHYVDRVSAECIWKEKIDVFGLCSGGRSGSIESQGFQKIPGGLEREQLEGKVAELCLTESVFSLPEVSQHLVFESA